MSYAADRYVSAPMTLSDLERYEGRIFQADFLNNARTVLPRTTKFDRITRVGEEYITRVSDALTVRGQGPKRFPIFTVPWCTYPLTQNSKFDVTRMGRGLFLDGQPRPHPKGGPGVPQF